MKNTSTVQVHNKVQKGVESVTITEFLEGRTAERQAVTRYIERHKEEFKEHISKRGREIEIDDVAFAILEKKYPLQSLVQVIEDKESRQKLIKAQEYIIQLQEKVNEQSLLIAKAESMQMLLDNKEQQLARSEQRENEWKEKQKQTEEELNRVREELEKERNKSWIAKLLRK